MNENSFVYVANSRNGSGLYAKKSFLPNKKVVDIVGKRVNYKLLLKLKGTFQDNCFRYGPITYLDPTGHVGMYINHSCQPNTKVVKKGTKLYIYSIKNIKKDEELTFDYSTVLASDDIWTLKCNCGQKCCRGIIKKYTKLPKELLQEYVDKKIIPEYILKL